jgi:hypothetical protein
MNAAIARTIWGGTWPAMAGRYTYAPSELACRIYKQKRTFIKAFESSPVHCLKPQPSGNRRRPGNKGTAAMLMKVSNKCLVVIQWYSNHTPLIYISKDHLSMSLSMDALKILGHPFDKVVFERALNNLV